MNDCRKLKVYEQSGYNNNPTSAIIMKGKWLEQFGFEPGAQVSVKYEEGKLTLTKVNVDTFGFLVSLVAEARKSIILIDNCVDAETLNILARKNESASVCIYTLRKTKLTSADVKNFNSQYPKLEVKHTRNFQDRFLIIDGIRGYRMGAPLRDACQKHFTIDMLKENSLMWDALKRLTLETA